MRPEEFDSMPSRNALSRINLDAISVATGQLTLRFMDGNLFVEVEAEVGGDGAIHSGTLRGVMDSVDVQRWVEVLTAWWTREYGNPDWCFEPHHQNFVNEIFRNAPESWDGEESAEHIALEYVRALEARVTALGGSLEKFPNGD